MYAILSYLTSYLCKLEPAMAEFIKRHHKEDIIGKIHFIGNMFLTKHELSTHETVKRALSVRMRHSNTDVPYVLTSLKKNRTRMWKSLSILEKNDKNKSQSGNFHLICLADLAFSYACKKAGDVTTGPDKIKSYTVPLSMMYWWC